MNNEDKELIREYMGWETTVLNWWRRDDSGIVLVDFDLNDAGLCVKEMQRRGDDYIEFIKVAYDMAFNAGNTQFHTVTAWLYDADNFFKAMAAWLKEENK